MRNKFLLLFTTIFCLIVGITANASTYKTEVKVGIKYGSSAGNSVKVASAGGLNIYNAMTGDVLYTAQSNEEVNISMWTNGFSSWNKFQADGVMKLSAQVPGGGIISCDGTKYRGYIYIERTSSGELLVINYVGTDDYVTSVLGKEMSYTWPNEALKAQAVCARNFVLCRGSAHKNYGFDVCPTTHCQVYGGVASEHDNTRRAVNETKGVLAKYNGEVVPLYFFATSAGHTESVENVWGSKIEYLKAVPDPYENPNQASRYSWTTTLSRSDIEKKVKAYGGNIGTLQSITLDSVTSSGRVTKMTFHGTSGTYTAKLEKCRTILGLYSQKFTIKSDGPQSIVTTGGSATEPFYACTATGVSGIAGFSAVNGSGAVSEVYTTTSAGGESYTIIGGGYGHGVGMSQWGARGMAENGFTYDKILKHYFANIELG